jgi:hypothetical protein
MHAIEPSIKVYFLAGAEDDDDDVADATVTGPSDGVGLAMEVEGAEGESGVRA